ncbi:phosphoglycerate dehydrogenase [Peptostreptococcus canis]|uniref:Dihydrofolate reductase n=1 Tax=Peptostreptococcus canis TaxID=1159213 RepID=A0ABR6TM69_9FIRM|nr:phosphoglycerate dehydrogenase [Peptostreptococcus canis]MBC2576415.1 dihydrofolate reductase [Peptostreptococcus canis]MBP1998390.1 phosphoglycerate dehydrogenase-like enzyme [Peptostreptococcus canis]
MKILINRNLGKEKMKEIEELGYEIIFIPEKELYNTTKEELGKKYDLNKVYEVDVWFTYMGFDFLDITKMKNLKYVHLTSAGINQVPVDYLEENNIYLSNNTTGYAVPMAESIVMYILEVYKNSYKMFKSQEEKNWKTDMSWMELAGKKVGFLGTGNIAKEAAKRLRAFEVDIWGVNTDGRDIEFFDRCFSVKEMDLFFKECDVVIGLMPATDKTTGIVNSSKFEIMKKDSIFINIGRGNLVNERDLEKYVSKFRGVVLDVVENEPLSKDSILWECENVIITPHNSWVSENNINRLGIRVYENLKSFIETGRPNYYMRDIKRGY